jgi:hypothetical protein
MRKYRGITRELDRAKMLRNLIFPEVSQRLFLSVFPKTRSVTQKHMELMADEIDYGQYTRFIIGGIARYVVRKTIFPGR